MPILRFLLSSPWRVCPKWNIIYSGYGSAHPINENKRNNLQWFYLHGKWFGQKNNKFRKIAQSWIFKDHISTSIIKIYWIYIVKHHDSKTQLWYRRDLSIEVQHLKHLERWYWYHWKSNFKFYLTCKEEVFYFEPKQNIDTKFAVLFMSFLNVIFEFKRNKITHKNQSVQSTSFWVTIFIWIGTVPVLIYIFCTTLNVSNNKHAEIKFTLRN